MPTEIDDDESHHRYAERRSSRRNFGRREDDDYPKIVVGPKTIATLVVLSNLVYTLLGILVPGDHFCP